MSSALYSFKLPLPIFQALKMSVVCNERVSTGLQQPGTDLDSLTGYLKVI